MLKLKLAVHVVLVLFSFSFSYADTIDQYVPITYGELITMEYNSKHGVSSYYARNRTQLTTDFQDIPANDSCENAELIPYPYPYSGTGTSIDATLDCPSLLYWYGVWYMIELPYEYNDLTITICGLSEDLIDAGIIIMDDCNCDDLIGASTITFLDQSECSTGFSGLKLEFNSIPISFNSDSLVYWPVFTSNSEGQPIDFEYEVNITEGEPPPIGDTCEDPIIIPGLPYADTLNSCDFNNEYNFSGNDVVYEFELDSCRIVDISLCDTDPIFDSYLLLYNISDCGNIPIATDDDACMGPGEYGTSRIIDTLEAGVYNVVIDAYSGECGEYVLEITTTTCPIYGACCIETECVATILEQSCDSLGGEWIANEDCGLGYMCPGSCQEFLLGDINMAGGAWPPVVIGADVTYLVYYFRGSELHSSCLLNDFWCSADVNGDCLIIGSDVTLLVNYFRGLATLVHCEDCSSCWLAPEDIPDDEPEGWPNCDE